MKLLALDTSSLACSIAVELDGQVHATHEEQEREHTRLLMPMVRELLEKASCDLTSLDAIVLGNGPGSFIGMRIAASVAQGLAHGAGINIVPVSSLAAVAAQVLAETDAQEVVVTQDAHMNEVYLGRFGRDDNGRPAAIGEEFLQEQAEIAGLDASSRATRLAAGAGWERYPDLMVANNHLLAGHSGHLYPDARYLLKLASIDAAIPPEIVSPAYLRQKVAEKPRPRQS